MINYYFEVINLIRLRQFTGVILVFLPSLFATLVHSIINHSPIDSNFVKRIVLFFLGSFFTRSAGCIINDLFDQKIDAKVERTKNRPLARQTLNNKDAILLLSVFLLMSLLVLLRLNLLAIKISCIALLMLTIYPLTKRFLKIPQIFLGLTFNTGSLIAYASFAGRIDFLSVILYLGCNFWTLGYDTIYAFSDIICDKKLKIKSSAIYLEHKNYRFITSFFYFIFLLTFLCITLYITYYHLRTDQLTLIFILCVLWLLISATFFHIRYKLHLLNYNDPEQTLRFFKKNNILGIFLTIILIMIKLLQIT